MKYLLPDEERCIIEVTPFAGVWIEMLPAAEIPQNKKVTPFAGVWIEIQTSERVKHKVSVTPFAGVWIEILTM